MEKSLVAQLTKAIPLRHSVRTYAPQALPKDTLDNIEQFIANLNLPFAPSATFRPFEAPPGKKLYNNGVNPVNNYAVMAQTDLLSISKAGFAAQLVMLYAVSLGLGTCWFGHYKLAELGQYFPELATPERIKESNMGYGYGKAVDVGERAIVCMPFGHRDESRKRFVDFVAGKNGAKRKDLSLLMEDPSRIDSMPPYVRASLELARLAPSAANSQFWRFGLSEECDVISVAKPIGYKHFKWEHPDVDIGMCAAHLWLGLLESGIEAEVSARIDADRALWSFTIN